MKKIFYSFLFILNASFGFAQFAHQNINLLDSFNDPSVTSEPVYGIRYQGCWGWRNPADGKEYGIIGSTAGTYILDVSNPSNIIQRDYVPGRRGNCIWHEYKSYDKYLYILSDDGGNNSFQIADMSYLPDSVHIIYDDTTLFVHGHTLYIDGNYLYVGSVSRPNGVFYSMAVYSLADPALPVLKRTLNQDYSFISHVHDMFVINDTVYASCGYQGLYIFKYNTATNHFVQLGSLPGSSSDYNHSSFISKDHSTLYVCIEVPSGRPIQVVDISDIANPVVVNTFITHTGATPHNPYVLGDYLVLATYQDGLYVYNLYNPHTPVNSGYFDTHPQNGTSYPYPPYAGCWGAYTDLPSGILLASDMQLGLFVLDVSVATSIGGISSSAKGDFSVYPNPVSDLLNVRFDFSANEQIATRVYSADGKLVYEKTETPANNPTLTIDTRNFSPGIYYLKVTTKENSFVRMINVRK